MKRTVPVQIIPAHLSAGLLPDSGQGRVLHVFEQAANLVFRETLVISLVNPEPGPGPFAFVLAEDLDFREILDIQSKVALDGKTVLAGEIAFDFSIARTWNAVPSWELKENRDWALPILEDIQRRAAVQPGLRDFHIPATWTRESAAEMAAGLAGLGPGLTPSGDDILMGVMHALWATFAAQDAKRICGWLAEMAIPRTTTLSGAWLDAASQGRAGRPWHTLLEAIRLKNAPRLRRAAQSILETGHTSGADALSGFCGGLYLDG